MRSGSVGSLTLVDALGREHAFARRPQRIVSLVPSITETLFALGAGSALVGATDYCVHPEAELADVPRVGGTKNADLERIRALRPDLVLANKEENRRRTVEQLQAAGVPVFVTYPCTVHGALEDIAMLGRLLERPGPAAAVVERIERAWVTARERAAETPPAVAALIWKGPYMAVGGDTFADALLAEAGARNVFAGAHAGVGGRYPRIGTDELASAAPEVILLPTEPYAFCEADRAELLALDCPAARDGRIHVVEGELLSWYGPRIARALELFSSLFSEG